MLESRTISISINRNWQEVYEALWRPEDFPKWASGLSKSALTREGDAWKAEGPDGALRITFTGHNAFGVMDHTVNLANGAEVLLTLFRQPDMSDAELAADAEWIARDLLALKALVSR